MEKIQLLNSREVSVMNIEELALSFGEAVILPLNVMIYKKKKEYRNNIE